MDTRAICITIFVILPFVVLLSGLVVMPLFVLPEYQKNRYELNVEMIAFENISFEGASGEANNRIILFLENPHSKLDVVLEQANVTGYGVNEMFSIAPEEKNFLSKTQGQVTLLNVGWSEGYEYTIELSTPTGNKFRSVKVTA